MKNSPGYKFLHYSEPFLFTGNIFNNFISEIRWKN